MIKQLPISLHGARKGEVRSQFAALCYRIKRGKVQVLLVTSRGSKRWIVPKGWPMEGKTPAASAKQEAWEEAGVYGRSVGSCLGVYSYAKDVNDNHDQGKSQFDFRLLPKGRAMGLTDRELGRQLRGAFFGSLALRLLRGTNEIEVRVKLPEEQRQDIHHLQDLVIRTPDRSEVPLLEVAELVENQAFSSINRRNGRRVIGVSMDAEPAGSVNQLIHALKTKELPELRRDFPGLTWTFEGNDAEMRNATTALWGYFGLALAVIYSLLAIAFRGYIQPLIVLAAIPFGMVGALIGHLILGYDLSLVSVMGVIALSGVVINDSLLMIDYANRQRREMGAWEAIVQAGVRRFRPILLTTLTTFGGLLPLIFEKSIQAQYIIPMAISLGFGILFSTAIVLVLVPCLYMILEDLQKPFQSKLST